jgi:hypothetical protein
VVVGGSCHYNLTALITKFFVIATIFTDDSLCQVNVSLVTSIRPDISKLIPPQKWFANSSTTRRSTSLPKIHQILQKSQPDPSNTLKASQCHKTQCTNTITRRLLRKVDFHNYKSDGGHREHQVRQRYLLQDPMDYKKYNALCGSLRQLAHKLSQLDPETDPLRKKLESELLEKLWRMGILKQSREQGAGLSKVEREVTVSALCRRRLAVFMVRSGMVETIKAVSLPCTR